jgi:4-amino-4-deoxy-L-arabinose transferase-like glycosyltransferase
VFGVNAWSILVPEALEGVATVALLYATVRRRFSAGTALLAGVIMALTPVAALMFRYNNPDALLVLVMVAAAYATVRALERAQTWWLVAAGTLLGFGFLTKLFQALLVAPALFGVYLLAAPTPLRRRILQVVGAGAAFVVAGGWWVAVVSLIPAADRPYIGGSQNNTLFNVIFGYNGFGRLTGNEAGSVGGGGTTGSRWGATGLTRLFQSDMGGQISWLLPAALVLLAAGLVVLWRRPRTDGQRAAFLLWGGWLLVTGAVFSLGAGIIHPYYTVALAPSVAALVAMGTSLLWARRRQLAARLVLGATLALTAVWSYELLDRSPTWHPWLRSVILVAGLATAVLLAAVPRLPARAAMAVGAVGLAVALAGPAAYTLDTVTTPHSGAIPSAGPTVAGAFGPGGGGRPGGAGFGGGPGAANGGGFGGPGGGFSGSPAGGPPTGAGGQNGFGGPGGGFGGGGFGGGGVGGILNATTPSAAVTRLLQHDASSYRWVAAAISSNAAAGYQLASGEPVMALGGFNGTDPAPTLAQFKAYVAEHAIHYFVASASGGRGTSVADQIDAWVISHFNPTTVGGTTVYDLTRPLSAG